MAALNPLRHGSILVRRFVDFAKNEILGHRIQYHNPTLRCEHPVVWRYGYRSLDSIEIGQNVHVMAFAEIVVHKHTSRSSREGRLVLGDGSIIGTGVNIRAAGGRIVLGRNSGIGEYSVVTAANHAVYRGARYLREEWDDARTDVIVGENVWVGAGSTLLPGCRIGDNSVIGAGAVVSGEVPPNEIWAGVPARKIREVPTKEEYEARKADYLRRSRPAT